MGIVQSKTLQNLVVLMEPSEDADRVPLKAGNMMLNRFCIDEDAAFELSGVNYGSRAFSDERVTPPYLAPKSIKESSAVIKHGRFDWHGRISEWTEERKEKGKECLFLQSYLILRNLIFVNN